MNLSRALPCVLLVVASLGAPAPAPAAPPEPAPRHGGRLLPHASAVLEVVHDGETGTLTLHVSKPSGGALELGRPPRYAPAGAGSQALAMTAVPQAAGAWRVSDPALKGKRLSGTLELLLDDAPQTLALAERPERLEGILLFGGDALRLRFRTDAADGSLELSTVSATDALALGDETPHVLVEEAGREAPLPLARRSDAQDSVAWSARNVAAVKDGGTLRVRAKVGAKTHEARLHLAADEAVGAHGGKVLMFGDGVARVEVVHDPEEGFVAFHALPTPADPRAAKPTDVTLRLTTKDGSRDLKAGPLSDCVCVWLVRAPELKDPAFQGSVRVTVGGEALEAPLPSPAKPAEVPASAKPADEGERASKDGTPR